MNNKRIRLITAGIAICIFTVILICVVTEASTPFDDSIRYFFYGLRNEALTGAAIVVTTMADKFFIIALCIVLLILPATRKTFGIPLSAGALGGTLLNQVLKRVVQRPRPDYTHLVEESGFSFASGHSLTSFFFYGMAIWLVLKYVPNKKARIILTVLLAIPLIFVGPTRVYLGVHYPTDVLAGWCLGAAIIIVVIEVLDFHRKES